MNRVDTVDPSLAGDTATAKQSTAQSASESASTASASANDAPASTAPGQGETPADADSFDDTNLPSGI